MSEGNDAPREPSGPRSETDALGASRWQPEIQRVPGWLGGLTAWTWRMLVVIVGAGAILFVLSRLYLVTLPVIVALILATLLVPPARALEARGFPRAGAALTVVLGGFAAFFGILAALTPAFIAQVQELRPTVEDAFSQVLTFAEENFGYDREELAALGERAFQQAQGSGGEVAGQVAAGAGAVVEFLAALLLIVVLLFFFVKDGEYIVNWITDRAPAAHRNSMRAVGHRAWVALAGFVRGTAVIAAIDAIAIGIGLVIVGVPLVLPLSVLIFFGAFIPVIGAFVTGLLAVLVALASGGLTSALIVLAIILGVQQVEGNVLQPIVMRRSVALHPVVVLLALTAGAALLGVVGAFLAVPVAAVAAAVGNELRLRTEARERGEPVDHHPLGPVHEPAETNAS